MIFNRKMGFCQFPDCWRTLLVECLILLYIDIGKANEVVGCGGFIKSRAEIDFAKVEVRLFTKQGVLKDKTDCSPSNGYYFLPIYDKGDYVLRITPPAGWSFEPNEVKLNFDGETDLCSRGQDVNFQFKGFGITGKVKLNEGTAHGVRIELRSSVSDDMNIRATKTDVNGLFSFTPVIPGEYIVKVSYPHWHFERAEYKVTVREGNTVLTDDYFKITGFDVIGKFGASVKEFNNNIGLGLFQWKDSKPLKCEKGNIAYRAIHQEESYNTHATCYAKNNDNGEYMFSNIAPGRYLLVPSVEDEKLKLHWEPKHLEIEVINDTKIINTEFQILGFDITGRVLKSVNGTQVAGALIKLNGQRATITDRMGNFVLSKISTVGFYTLQVEAPHMQFSEQNVNLQMSTSSLPTIIATAFEVCGRVVAKNSYNVDVTSLNSSYHVTISTDSETGKWCTYLPSASYRVRILGETNPSSEQQKIKFSPLEEIVHVISDPIEVQNFTQLRAKIQGTLNCLSDAPTSACLSTEVNLINLDNIHQSTDQKRVTIAKDGHYMFENVLPGYYEITIQRSKLCFDTTRILITVVSLIETASVFQQRGYEIDIISSHQAMIKYTHSITGITNKLKLLPGVNTLCVPKMGMYNLTVEGCHLYELPASFNTMDASASIIINAVAHKVGIRIHAPEPSAPKEALQLLIESPTSDKELIQPEPEIQTDIHPDQNTNSKFTYRYETYLRPNEALVVTPKSEIWLFEPTMHKITGDNDCVDLAGEFHAKRGLILMGKVMPLLKDAKIILNFPHNPEMKSHVVMTSKKGDFKFAPISEKLKYELTAQKDSYVFAPFNYTSKIFHVQKLCEIVVKVKDESERQLSGVLISLSGAESYRKNLVTLETGVINFHSLTPSQYFIRPMMKEYKFDPSSKIIDLKNGETVYVDFIAKRIAYSVYGVINSLNGKALANLNVEAVSNEDCQNHQEEATTDSNHQYRLRGLQPNCEYSIRLKNSDHISSDSTHPIIERTIPLMRQLKIIDKDIYNINMTAITQLTYVDVIARVTTSSNDWYKTLNLVMYRKSAFGSPIYSQRVESPFNIKARFNPGIMVALPRVPFDKKTAYVLELKTTLSDSIYTYKLPSQQFIADAGTVFIELDFQPAIRQNELELNHSSISALILVALITIAFFKQNVAIYVLNFIWLRLRPLFDEFIIPRQKSNIKWNMNNKSNEPINQIEIEQMADEINNIKKKRPKKI